MHRAGAHQAGGHLHLLGSTLVAALEDGRIELWDLASGDGILGGESLGERIHAVSFTPDGTALALGWGSATASIWEVPARADAATLVVEYPANRVDAAAFSPGGSLILSGSYSDGSVVVEVRDVATGTLLATPTGHRGEVETVAFSRDGSTFASSSQDATILVWDLGLLLPHPQTLARLSGDEQQGEPGTPLGEALVVSVQDQNGAAFPGAVVTFAVLGDVATLSALTDTTDAEGRAATTLTLGEETGTYTVVATVADLEPVTFTVTAKASPDFDGDGEVGFSDFFLFAEHFGGSDPRFDLDGSGSVDFTDFFLFPSTSGSRRGPGWWPWPGS